MSDRVKTTCPCCHNRLTVDVATGEVLAEERPKKDPTKTFDEAVGKVRAGASRREEAFSDAFKKTKNLDDVLEKKFEEARKKAAKEKDIKPLNPFDAD